MIYDFDTIPAKLFFKINKTGNINLLSTEKDVDCSKEWGEIQKSNESYDKTNSIQKTVNVLKKIESFSARHEAINLAIHCLKRKVDNELIEILTSRGYSFKWNEKNYSKDIAREYLNDLEQIEKETEVILYRIKELEEKLPKSNEKGIIIDEVILGYAIVLDQGFIDTNKITLLQYYTNIKLGNEKIKNIEKVSKKHGKKR